MKGRGAHWRFLGWGTLVVVVFAGLSGCRGCPGAFFGADLAGVTRRATCVWAPGIKERTVDLALKRWAERHRLGHIDGWDAAIEPKQARLTLRLMGRQRTLLLSLKDDCGLPPVVQEISATGKPAFPAVVLRDLGRVFPAPRRLVNQRSGPRYVGKPAAGSAPQTVYGPPTGHTADKAARRDPSRVRPRGTAASPGEREASVTHQWTFLIVGVFLVLGAWFTDRLGPRPRLYLQGVVLFGVAALAAVAAAPLFEVPFTHDAQWLRVGYARESVFGDWNHPFLPYLLNRPATWFSLEPWALRIIPFGWVVAECTLLVVAATRRGGNLAGALAGVWFACEVRRRHGLNELADWDLAGTFLLALLLWMQTSDKDARMSYGRMGLLAVLLVAALFSSWLMIVPITVAVGVLWLAPRKRWPALIVATVVWFGLSALALRVFGKGSPGDPDVAPFGELIQEMLLETPALRAAWMLPLLAAGLVWLAWGWRKMSHRFVLGALVAIPVAIFVAWKWSQVHGGYYLSLTTPLLLFAAAVALSRSATRLRDGLAPRCGAWFCSGLGAAVLLGVVVQTVILPPMARGVRLYAGGTQNVSAFERRASGDKRLIFTNFFHLPLALSYERARRGGPIPGGILRQGGPPDFAPRIRRLDRRCRPKAGWPPAGTRLYLVFGHQSGHWPNCAATLPVTCKPLYPESFLLNFYDCRVRSGSPARAAP